MNGDKGQFMNSLLGNSGKSRWAKVSHSCTKLQCKGAYYMVPEPMVRVRIGIEIDDDIHSAVVIVQHNSLENAYRIAESFRASVEADINTNAMILGATLIPGEQWLNLV